MEQVADADPEVRRPLLTFGMATHNLFRPTTLKADDRRVTKTPFQHAGVELSRMEMAEELVRAARSWRN